MKLKRRVEKAVKWQIVRYLADFIYFIGLTSLIPLLPVLLDPQQFVDVRLAFMVALGLIFVSFTMVYWWSGSRKVALRTLGYTTLIPGMIAVFIIFTPPRRLAKLMGYFGGATPFIEKWIGTFVPSAWLLAGLYIILGVTLVWLAEKVHR